jgi:uncharacterized protein (DUF697 family)
MRDAKEQAEKCYKLTDSKANDNSVTQGVSGIFGFPLTLIADVGVIPAIYLPLWDQIRAEYGHDPITNEEAVKVIQGIMVELLADLVFDKFLGNVPLIGIYFNAICAKTMTWRLGTLFSMLSARGNSFDEIELKDSMILIRQMFPQKDMFSFTTPNKSDFVQIVVSVTGESTDEYGDKIKKALACF